MYIVGTSGHIDHGKTSLIRALTGIDCDRLPEEKEREMTIDIGFASMDYPRFGTVSIIDVPGHERFIRNMVAGAWGIDLALLVIALDDGWMLQTEDHFRVLDLLGIERIIVVINKVDLGDEEMIEIVKEEVRERLEHTRYSGADIAAVSARTGYGIEDLRETIVANLRKLSKAADSDKPYLFIDRVFSPRGVGVVITGTLKNGTLADNETVTLLPHKREVKIKKIESHHKELEEGAPSQRTALNISNVTMDELRRGDIICKKNFFTETEDIVGGIKLMPDHRKIRNNTFVEVLAGTDSVKAKLIMLSDDASSADKMLVRLRLEEKTNLYPGESFILTAPGGYRIIGGGTVVIADYNPIKHKKNMKKYSSGLDYETISEIISYNISVNGWEKRDNVISFLPGSRKGVERILAELENKKMLLPADDYLFWPEFYHESKNAIKKTLIEVLGPNMKEISDKSGVDFEICSLIMKDVLKEETLIEKDGRYFTRDSVTADTLPRSKKMILETAMKNRGDGIELDKIKDDIQKKEIGDLIKLNFLVSLDGNIIYHKDVYEEMKKKILSLFQAKDKITVPEAKDAVDLSRKYIIPLLNRIESEGLMKRLGDFRMKG